MNKGGAGAGARAFIGKQGRLPYSLMATNILPEVERFADPETDIGFTIGCAQGFGPLHLA
jgi:hypothetical protein